MSTENVSNEPKGNGLNPVLGNVLFSEEDLKLKLIVGAKIKIGKRYADQFGFESGEVIELIEGSFEYDNGLYTENQSAPAIWDENGRDFESIYHLFGNHFEDFLDCEVLS